MMAIAGSKNGWRNGVGFFLLFLVVVGIGPDFYRQLPVTASAGIQEGFLAPVVLPPGLVASNGPERFLPETLFEVINGEADLYLKAGFVALETRRYFGNGNERQWLEIFAYRMAGHRNAFAVYSLRRIPDAQPDDLANYAYRYQDALAFVHGAFYVEIRAAEATEALMGAATDLAEAFMAAHPSQDARLGELALFPPGGLVPASQALHLSGGFGFAGFDGLFTARYRMDGGEATAFFRPCSSREEAQGLAAGYGDFLLAYDGEGQTAAGLPPRSRLIRVMDTYTLVFARGTTVAGVVDAASPALAGALGQRLYERLADE